MADSKIATNTTPEDIIMEADKQIEAEQQNQSDDLPDWSLEPSQHEFKATWLEAEPAGEPVLQEAATDAAATPAPTPPPPQQKRSRVDMSPDEIIQQEQEDPANAEKQAVQMQSQQEHEPKRHKTRRGNPGQRKKQQQQYKQHQQSVCRPFRDPHVLRQKVAAYAMYQQARSQLQDDVGAWWQRRSPMAQPKPKLAPKPEPQQFVVFLGPYEWARQQEQEQQQQQQ